MIAVQFRSASTWPDRFHRKTAHPIEAQARRESGYQAALDYLFLALERALLSENGIATVKRRWWRLW